MRGFRGVLSDFGRSDFGRIAALLLGVTLVGSGCTTDDAGADNLRPAATAESPGAAWFDEYPALTVTLVEGGDPAALVRTMYGEELRPAATKAAADRAAADDGTWVAAGKIDGWTFVWEDDGWQGSDLAKAEALSRGTRLVSAFWNANDVALATVANNGRVTRQFDRVSRTEPDRALGSALPDEGWLDWDHDWTGAMLTLQSRLTGLPLANPSWLDDAGVRFWTAGTD
jgi:hypothetical protein